MSPKFLKRIIKEAIKEYEQEKLKKENALSLEMLAVANQLDRYSLAVKLRTRELLEARQQMEGSTLTNSPLSALYSHKLPEDQ